MFLDVGVGAAPKNMAGKAVMIMMMSERDDGDDTSYIRAGSGTARHTASAQSLIAAV